MGILQAFLWGFLLFVVFLLVYTLIDKIEKFVVAIINARSSARQAELGLMAKYYVLRDEWDEQEKSLKEEETIENYAENYKNQVGAILDTARDQQYRRCSNDVHLQ